MAADVGQLAAIVGQVGGAQDGRAQHDLAGCAVRYHVQAGDVGDDVDGSHQASVGSQIVMNLLYAVAAGIEHDHGGVGRHAGDDGLKIGYARIDEDEARREQAVQAVAGGNDVDVGGADVVACQPVLDLLRAGRRAVQQDNIENVRIVLRCKRCVAGQCSVDEDGTCGGHSYSPV